MILYKVSFSLFIIVISNIFPMNLCWFVVGKLWVVVDLCLGVETFVCRNDMTILGLWLVFQFTKKLYTFVHPIHLEISYINID